MKKFVAIGCLCALLSSVGCGSGEKGPVEETEVKPADPQLIQDMMKQSMQKMGKNVPTGKLPTEAPKQ